LIQNIGIGLRGNKTNSETLGSKTAGTPDSVQISVSIVRHVVVDYNIYALHINAATEQIGGNHYPSLEFFELAVFLNSFLLLHDGMNANRWEVAVVQKFVELRRSSNRLYKDNTLVELESIKQINQFAVLLIFIKLHKILL